MMDEDEESKLRRELAQQIETAFADVPYPGDDNIISNSDWWDSSHLPALFAGKHWKEIPLDIIIQERFNLVYFTPEGFRFYLPAFLRAAVLHIDDLDEVDTLPENIIYRLAPPEEDETEMQDFLNRISGFTQPQIEAIKGYIKLYVATYDPSYPDAARDRAGVFWQQRK